MEKIYSGESYHALAASIDGNSMITVRAASENPGRLTITR